MRKGFFACVWLITIAWMASSALPLAYAAGVVGNGTAASCTDTALNQALASGGSVTFNCGSAPVQITIGQKVIANTVVIDGGGIITLSGNDATRLFLVNAGASLTLRNITLTNGKAVSSSGGAIRNEGTVLIENSTIQKSIAEHDGGAVASYGTLTIYDSSLLENGSQECGGGIMIGAGTGTISNTTMISNTTVYGGGAIANGCDDPFADKDAVAGGTLVLSDATISYNTSTGRFTNHAGGFRGGGGIHNVATAQLDNVLLQGNDVADSGGAIFNKGSMAISNAEVALNTSSFNGGGVFSSVTGAITITDSLVRENENGFGVGGGIAAYGHATLRNVQVLNNRSNYSSAGVYVAEGDLENMSIAGNISTKDTIGGLHIDSGSLSNVSITGNTGIGLDITGAVSVTNSTISANHHLSNSGAGVVIAEYNVAPVTLTNTTIVGNATYSGGGGGGIVSGHDQVSLLNVVLADNAGENCSGEAFASVNYSLSSDASCAFTGTGNMTNTLALLGVLSLSEGSTATHIPEASSPLVDHGQCVAGITLDQCGIARPQGATCDIGAVERRAEEPLNYFTALPAISRQLAQP